MYVSLDINIHVDIFICSSGTDEMRSSVLSSDYVPAHQYIAHADGRLIRNCNVNVKNHLQSFSINDNTKDDKNVRVHAICTNRSHTPAIAITTHTVTVYGYHNDRNPCCSFALRRP